MIQENAIAYSQTGGEWGWHLRGSEKVGYGHCMQQQVQSKKDGVFKAPVIYKEKPIIN